MLPFAVRLSSNSSTVSCVAERNTKRREEPKAKFGFAEWLRATHVLRTTGGHSVPGTSQRTSSAFLSFPTRARTEFKLHYPPLRNEFLSSHLKLELSMSITLFAGFLSLVLAIFLPAVSAQSATELRAIIRQKEEAITRIAKVAEDAFNARCSLLPACNSAGGTTCSLTACSTNFPASRGFGCSYAFGNASNVCGCDGLVRSQSDSTMYYPDTLQDQQRLGEFACFSKNVNNAFRTETTLDAWRYVGHDSGALRLFPGIPQERGAGGQCSAFDPRIRPWYVAASGGPKDVVVVFERSHFMSSTWEETKCSLFTLLDSFTPNDYVNLIGYNGESVIMGDAVYLTQATVENINSMKRALLQVEASGREYDDRQALRRAFEMLQASQAQSSPRRSSGCTSVIILMTDGLTQSSLTNGVITEGQSTLRSRAHIFGMSIYADSEGALDRYLQAVACANEGVWTQVRGDTLAKLRPYFQFLSLGVTADRVAWTNPYIDAFGLGRMVTVSAPFFDRSKSPPIVVGVAGTDVPLSDLGSGYTAIGDILIEAGQSCPAIKVDACTLQLIRSQSGYVCPTTATNPSVATCETQREISSTACSTTTTVSSVSCNPPTGGGSADIACCSAAQRNGICVNGSAPAARDTGVVQCSGAAWPGFTHCVVIVVLVALSGLMF